MIIQDGVNITGGVGFLNPSTMPSTVEYLVVAGGGAGGGAIGNYSTGGGGGAGGYLTGTTNLTNTNVGRTYADSAYTASGWTTGTNYSGSTGAFVYSFGSIQQSSGGARTVSLPEVDTYFEILISTSTNFTLVGLCRDTSAGGYNNVPSIYLYNGTAFGGLSGGTSLGAFVAGDVLCIAYKAATNKVYLGKNGTWYADPISTAGATIPGTGNLRFIIMAGTSGGVNTSGTFRVNTQNTYAAPSGYTTMAASIAVTIGAGGPAGAASAVGTSGADSVFSTITSIGGGRGSANGTGAQVGGSGGGGSSNVLGSYSLGTVGQGNNGGDPSTGYPYPSGGGGGAGAVGGTGGSGAGGPGIGGVGLSSSISGTATYYAGGGGGSLVVSGSGGAGGNGGGGAGGTPGGTGVSGTANTGGGGGGSGGTVSAAGTGGSGGSGIVVIRYEDTYLAASSTTGSPTITVAGGYRIYTWTTSGSISFVPVTPTVEYLVVAGGAGGGAGYGGGGGGGAGGLLTDTGLLVASGSAITVTVGSGGTASFANPGTVGGNSSIFGSEFTTVTSVGGGLGGYDNGTTLRIQGGNGGSGGGKGGYGTTVGKGVYPGSTYLSQPRQGYDGGNNDSTAGGGGGGAGAVGVTSTGYNGGAGGSGTASSLTGASVTYAGGGGGGGTSTSPGGAGGAGGGGAGGAGGSNNGFAGSVNTGSGGGGGGDGNNTGGAGGSGIVIIRYPSGYAAASSTTGSPTITLAGGYRIYTWTSSGSITF